MKKTILMAAFTMAALVNFAQDTTTVTITSTTDTTANGSDTIKIGSMVIIKSGKASGDKEHKEWHYQRKSNNNRKETSWLLLDLGFSNWQDKTNYGSAAMDEFTGNQDFDANDFTLRNGKSFNINVWVLRQRYGITKNNTFNLTYGLMIETTNFRFENNISFKKGGPPYVAHDNVDFSKNKLATSYLTVPVMLGFNTNPKSNHGFNASAGVSVGYLYSSRNKQISDERGKQKNKGSFNLEPWKVQMIGEVGIGSFKIYGSYSPNNMFKSGLDMRPYTVGLRFSDWD